MLRIALFAAVAGVVSAQINIEHLNDDVLVQAELPQGTAFKLWARIETIKGDNAYELESSKHNQLAFHDPKGAFQKGYKVTYALSFDTESGPQTHKGSFTFKGRGAERRKRRAAKPYFGFGFDGVEPGYVYPKAHGLGHFPHGPEFPSHGPPPFFPPGRGFHGGWDRHHPHNHRGDDCDWPGHRPWKHDGHKFTGAFPSSEEEDVEMTVPSVQSTPEAKVVTKPLEEVSTSSTTVPTTTNLIDIRFG